MTLIFHIYIDGVTFVYLIGGGFKYLEGGLMLIVCIYAVKFKKKVTQPSANIYLTELILY